MEKVLVALDLANIERSAHSQGLNLDYRDLLDYLGDGRIVTQARCYVPIDPRNAHGEENTEEDLWCSGFMVTTKIGVISGDTYKCNFDVEMTVDVLRAVYATKPDIVVLLTGDGDFLPLVVALRELGIRVEVAAFQCSVARQLILRASGFVDLNAYLQSVASSNREIDADIRTEDVQATDVVRDQPSIQ